MRRRSLLATPLAATLLPCPRFAWAAAHDQQRLVVILLRGAVDGLSVVVPYGEAAYYRARPTIAIAPPGGPGGALRLDPQFALHLALADLMPLWDRGELAFVHAAGSPDPSRSHFAAQRYIESGTPGDDTTPDGWMNRLLSVLPGPRRPTEAISVGPTLPRILAGKAPATNFPLDPDAARPAPLDQPAIAGVFDQLYAGSGSLDSAYREGRAARARLIADLANERRIADGDAPPPRSFPAQAARLAYLLARDSSIRLVLVALGGWDTHVRQGAANGQLADRLRPLGQGIGVLARDLGAEWRDTAIVVLSEFGRTVAENGNGGTDHGHGTAIWVAGGAIAGRRIYGDWPGLAPDRLYQRRDLAVTTDFRSVLAALLTRRLHLSAAQLDTVFPRLPAGGPDLAALAAV